jgi:hypothetical protein
MGHIGGTRDRSGACGILFGKHERRNCLEDLGVNGRIILKWFFRKGGLGGMNWASLVQDRGRRWALVNARMNLWVS